MPRNHIPHHCMLPSIFWSTLRIALSCTLPFCLIVRSVLLSITHTQPAWLKLWSMLFWRSQIHSQAYFQEYSQWHSMAHSQPGWLSTPKSALMVLSNIQLSRLPNPLSIELDNTFPVCLSTRSQFYSPDAQQFSARTLPYIPPSAFGSSQPGLLSSYLAVALDRTLPACLTILFQVSAQDAPKHIPKHSLDYTSNCTQSPTSSLP